MWLFCRKSAWFKKLGRVAILPGKTVISSKYLELFFAPEILYFENMDFRKLHNYYLMSVKSN